MKVLVETSARHVHLNQESLEILFGKDFELTRKKDLSQPGQFLSNEKVEIVGSRSAMKNVSILGPLREEVQVEISKTDARALGIDVCIRESGDLLGTSGCKIIGPAGEIEIFSGVIVAKRHIHLSPEDAQKFNLEDKQIVSVKIESEERSLIFSDVVCRVSEKFSTAVHIDTDEANAANVNCTAEGFLIKNVF